MRFRIILVIFVIIQPLFGYDDLTGKVVKDQSLIVPGIGAEKVILNEHIGSCIQRLNNFDFKVSKPGKRSEIFKDIFNVESGVRIYFDEIYYFEEIGFAVFVYQRTVKAVVGFTTRRITIDSVSLARGADYFIFQYGNYGLRQLERGENRIYLYAKRGIAIVDDKNDGNIDMYLIFTPR